MTHVDLDVVPTSAPSLAEQGLLENMAVLSDDDLEEMNEKAERQKVLKKVFLQIYGILRLQSL